MHIQKAEMKDLEDIMCIYRIAQDFMIGTGNPDQWGRFYPKRELIEDDINNGVCHVICKNDSIHGVFALFKGREPTYSHIENGKWLNDDEYITVHRIAGDGKKKGIFACTINYCKSISDNIRIDTHENNRIMQKLIEKNGFQRCGTIFVANGSPRVAYQWTGK
ncbi:N-acetyltransferase [Methanobrevibacter millerae]|nr:N-acetyltransferase [Methanobrevibacter millerae]